MVIQLVFFAAVLASQMTLCTCDVNTTWMKEALTQHFSQSRNHVTNPQYKQRAMRFIRDQFRQMGLETHLHTFPTALSNVTGINVIGVLKGSRFNTPNDSVVGTGAHYDTMRHTPGVDDNGAAVVTMLQAARELSRNTNRKNTILFIAFDFEEWELLNTTQAACHSISCGGFSLLNQWLFNFLNWPVSWQGIFVMDTIMNFDPHSSAQYFPAAVGQVFPHQVEDISSDGGRGDFLMIAGRQQDQELLSRFNASWNKLGQPQFEIEAFTLPAVSEAFSQFLRSDHAAFWQANLAAIFISDTANFRGYMTQCYHHECDTIQRVTDDMINFAAKTCRTLISAVDSMSPVVGDTSSACQIHARGVSTGGLVLLLLMLVGSGQPA